MPFLNQHSARVIDHYKFDKESFVRKNIDKGVDIIVGNLKGEDTLTTQTYRFDSSIFTVKEAKEWLKKHNIDYISFEEAKNEKVDNMAEYIIPIHGVIGTKMNPIDKQKYFSYADLLMHIKKAKNSDILVLDIDSVGGYCDVADKMIDAIIKTGKEIISKNSGNVCSAATKLFMLGSTRVFNPRLGEFLIHNPWAEIVGDAETLLEMSLDLSKTEYEYVQFYSEKTGIDEDTITKLMSEDFPLTKEQIEEFNFADIVEEKVQAFAMLKLQDNNTETKMENKENNVVMEKLLTKLLAKFTGKKLNLMVSDVNGVELTIDSIEDYSQIEIGQKVTIGGKVAEDGEYELSNGDKIIIEGGIIKEIIAKEEEQVEEEVITEEETITEEEIVEEPVVETVTKEEYDNVVAENDELKAKIDELKAELEMLKSETVAELESELAKVKALSSDTNFINNVPTVKSEDSKGFSWKRK